ncbi:MAG: hypothetical protein ACPHTD_02790 [Gammaproteobacteria bacterium]|jgi:hypothetical protein
MSVTNTPARLSLFFLLAFNCCVSAVAEEDYGCTDYAEGMAERIKAILGPSYAGADNAAPLEDNLEKLQALTTLAGHCSAAARSIESHGPDRQRNIYEWHSINQWLARLVGAVSLSLTGKADRPWQDEYTLIAEVYEFEP